jgi:valyl-tRNA synthetase
MDAVTSGRVKITPERYAKGYLDWLAEKRDWPIGRQLWWGHRIPVWQITLQADHYQRETGSFRESLARVANEYHTALESFASAFGIEGDLATIPSETARTIYFICARTDRAQAELASFYRRHHPARHSTVTVKIEPYLDKRDPKFSADAQLWNLIALMDDQVSDVLDTWFSSALWPLSTLGWPDDTPELKKFYPTTALITSRDIITLWVARMVIAGLYNVGEVPFREVYVTPKILDGYGETMSKSKGNGVDPLDVIEKFGADALRFGLAYLTTDTQDVKMPVEFECPHCGATFPQTKKNRQLPRVECEKCGKPFSTQWAEKPEDKALPRGAVVSERFELGRNFANKLWNAARFSLINLQDYSATGGRGFMESELLLEDRWLLSRLATVTQQVTGALERYRYADAARTLYDFAWNEFCSFYVEMTKARFQVDESFRVPESSLGGTQLRDRQTAQRVLAHALDVLMRLLHPMMPFLTEEVWQLLGQVAPERGLTSSSPSPGPSHQGRGGTAAEESVCTAPWPVADLSYQDNTIEEQFADFQAVLGAVREIRQRQNIPPREEIAFAVRCDEQTGMLLRPMQPYFTQMARATGTAWGPEAAAAEIAASVTLAARRGETIEVHVDLSRFIDVAAERKRLEKDSQSLAKQIGGIEGKLANKNFVDKAPSEVVRQQRDKLAELESQLRSVESALAKLSK